MTEGNMMRRGDNHKQSGQFAENYYRNLASNTDFPNAMKELIRSGKDPRDLLMRTFFQDERRANQAVRLMMKFDRFNMGQRFYDMVLNKLAANCSLGGMSRAELVMSQSGVVSSNYVDTAAKQRSGPAFPSEKYPRNKDKRKDGNKNEGEE